jgi:hypothetical protein
LTTRVRLSADLESLLLMRQPFRDPLEPTAASDDGAFNIMYQHFPTCRWDKIDEALLSVSDNGGGD